MKQISTSQMQGDSDDATKLTQAAFDGARLLIGGRDVSKDEWQKAVRAQLDKQRTNIMRDSSPHASGDRALLIEPTAKPVLLCSAPFLKNRSTSQ